MKVCEYGPSTGSMPGVLVQLSPKFFKQSVNDAVAGSRLIVGTANVVVRLSELELSELELSELELSELKLSELVLLGVAVDKGASKFSANAAAATADVLLTDWELFEDCRLDCTVGFSNVFELDWTSDP